jgi:SAM-dependent methyltransferase
MLAVDAIVYVRTALPEPPARVLEVGAGSGELAGVLRGLGYDVLAIDPASTVPDVRPVALHDLEEEHGSFDATVAMLSLHHVEPLPASCSTLANLVRPGGCLVIDEFDVAAFDQRAARWWCTQRAASGHAEHHEPPEVAARLREHLHALSRIQAELSPYFVFGQPIRGAYLYRWDLDPGLRDVEERAIAAGQLPATGARLVGLRKGG